MKKTACQYAVLRFRPFVETGEFANVGLVLIAPEARFFDFRLIRKYGRITQFFHQLEAKVFTEARRLFNDELDRFADDIRRHALNPNMPDVGLAMQHFGELIRHRESVLYFDQVGTGLTVDPAAKLDALYDFFVERNFATPDYQERLLEKKVRRLLGKAHLTAQYRPQKVGTLDFLVSFPFVQMAGDTPARIIKPLDLAYADSTRILTHAGPWVDRIRRLRKRQALPDHVLFPLASPSEARASEAFDEIKYDLKNEGIIVADAGDEQAILDFAER